MTILLLIRHGETAWNKEEIFRGRTDVELNEKGLEQSELLAEYLADDNINAIYTSPLKRAVKTAEKIAKYHDCGRSIAPELIDMDFGGWQGLSLTAVQEQYPDLYGEWSTNPYLVKIPEGETLVEVKDRAMGLVDKIIAQPSGTVALISHRVVNKVLICTMLGLDLSRFWNIKLDTCGITIFVYEKARFVLTRHNDTSFLRRTGGNKLGDF